jgi:glycosyltransferase involved in cell wall biosynthesis
MRISFVMPGRSPVPIGGLLVAYELANRLAQRENRVAILQPRTVRAPSSLLSRLKAGLWVRRYRRNPRALVPWFEVDPRVRLLPATHLDAAVLPDADAIVATPTWETAHCVVSAPASKGGRFYFIQGDDAWFAAVEDVRAAWRLPLHKIVISSWLEEIAVELGEGDRTSRVPIGVDLDTWGVDILPERRGPRIGALLSPNKGEDEILAALALVRADVPGLTAAFYGTAAAPADLPHWAGYTRLPDRAALRRLYNSCAIFVQASREEGWGLPANEAMACGCALVTYDNGGSREYAIDGETARVLDGHGVEPLASAIRELIADEALRSALAARGRRLVGGFTWARAVDAFEAVLAGNESGG